MTHVFERNYELTLPYRKEKIDGNLIKKLRKLQKLKGMACFDNMMRSKIQLRKLQKVMTLLCKGARQQGFSPGLLAVQRRTGSKYFGTCSGGSGALS